MIVKCVKKTAKTSKPGSHVGDTYMVNLEAVDFQSAAGHTQTIAFHLDKETYDFLEEGQEFSMAFHKPTKKQLNHIEELKHNQEELEKTEDSEPNEPEPFTDEDPKTKAEGHKNTKASKEIKPTKEAMDKA